MMLRRGRLVGLCEDEMRFLWLDLHKFFFWTARVKPWIISDIVRSMSNARTSSESLSLTAVQLIGSLNVVTMLCFAIGALAVSGST